MKAGAHDGPPPEYCTATAAAARLGMSRQNFYQTGLAEAAPRWKMGRITLYRVADVDGLAYWLFVRQGLIARGWRRGDYPLNPTDSEYAAAVHAGRWTEECPVCGGPAVGEEYPDDAPVWCLAHGIVNP